MKIPEKHQKCSGTVGLQNEVIYGLAQAEKCWSSKVCNDVTGIEFEQ